MMQFLTRPLAQSYMQVKLSGLAVVVVIVICYAARSKRESRNKSKERKAINDQNSWAEWVSRMPQRKSSVYGLMDNDAGKCSNKKVYVQEENMASKRYKNKVLVTEHKG